MGEEMINLSPIPRSEERKIEREREKEKKEEEEKTPQNNSACAAQEHYLRSKTYTIIWM